MFNWGVLAIQLFFSHHEGDTQLDLTTEDLRPLEDGDLVVLPRPFLRLPYGNN